MAHLVLLRHGQSDWNARNLFTGWEDVDLSPLGEDEARRAGIELQSQQGRTFDLRVLHTSLLTRAVRTANLALDSMGRSWLPVRRHWRLNERHYGALQGRNKSETTAEFGEAQVKLWRRSYDVPPPAVAGDDPRHPANDPRYSDLPLSALPASECLKDVVARMVPHWEDMIVSDLKSGADVLVVAHGNSIRALAKHLLDIADDKIVDLEIPTGVPWVFELDSSMLVKSHRQLGDPDAIAAAAEQVARQADAPPA